MRLIQKGVMENHNFISENLEDLCASIQHSIITILLKKLQKSIKQTGIKEIAIAGGVSANSLLRNELKILSTEKKFNLYIPKFEYCTDNAAMIAITGQLKFESEVFSNLEISANPRLKI